jgi:hypothetical protein
MTGSTLPGQITIGQTGTYQFTAQASVQSPTFPITVEMAFFLNNSLIDASRAQQAFVEPGPETLSTTALIACNPGDTVQLAVSQSSGGTQSLGLNTTYLVIR